MRRLLGAALLTIALVASACSASTTNADGAVDTTTTTRQIVYGELTGPTTGRPLTVADPLRVTLFGDSVLYDAEPAVTANLTSTGVVRPFDRTVPGFNFGHGLSVIANDLNWRELITDMLRDSNPEVIVTWFGIIDSFGISKNNQTPEAFAVALREALTMMTTGTTKVIMFGVPPSVNDAGKQTVGPMNRDANPVMQQVASEFPGKVEYYDTELLLTPDGRAVYDANGLRVRKLDLIHICPDGAVLIADAIHDTLARSWAVPAAAPGWNAGLWRTAARYDDPPGACVRIHPDLGI